MWWIIWKLDTILNDLSCPDGSEKCKEIVSTTSTVSIMKSRSFCFSTNSLVGCTSFTPSAIFLYTKCYYGEVVEIVRSFLETAN